MVSAQSLDRFISALGLPSSFRQTAARFYEPLAEWLRDGLRGHEPFLLGINGAQGTGKTTLAAYLALSIREAGGHTVAVLSIDDFYLTRAERRALAQAVHPLLATRSVPGTHDVPMLRDYLDRLRSLGMDDRVRLPRFDKAVDDRADEASWPAVQGPVDLIILEGWCVGSVAEPDAGLAAPVNALEKEQDADGRWRRYVNDRLATDYAEVFAELDALVFLQAPDFDAVLRWRIEQEHKLAAAAVSEGPGIMSDAQVREFVQYFERITRNNLDTVRSNADIVFELDEYHDCIAAHYRE